MTNKNHLRYYAVADPDTGDMTFWYRNKKGKIEPWPRSPKPHYGPSLWKRTPRNAGAHDHVTPSNLSDEERRAWKSNWFASVQGGWFTKMHETIERDESQAMARFATINTRCCICGKLLTDPQTKVNGIGPECRKDYSDAFVLEIQGHMSTLIGEWVQSRENEEIAS